MKLLKSFLISNEDEMVAFGHALADSFVKLNKKGLMVYLQGELGAGKTTLVRGFLERFSIVGPVKSPTFTLVEPYEFEHVTVFHFDLYRLNSPWELENIGIRDYLEDGALCLIEWPEKGEYLLPEPDLVIIIILKEGIRELKLYSRGEAANNVLEALSFTPSQSG